MKTLITLVLVMLVGCESSQPSGNNNNTTNNSINNNTTNNSTNNNTNSTNNTTCILGDAVGSPCSSECTCISVNGLTCNLETNLCEFSIDCGNGIIDGTETCDGTNLGGNTCEALGFSGGVPTCNACEPDTLSCECGEGYIYEPTLNLCHVDTTTTIYHVDCWGQIANYSYECYWEFCDGEAIVTKTMHPSGTAALGDPNHCGDCDTICTSEQECMCVFDSNESISFHTVCNCE